MVRGSRCGRYIVVFVFVRFLKLLSRRTFAISSPLRQEPAVPLLNHLGPRRNAVYSDINTRRRFNGVYYIDDELARLFDDEGVECAL
jgi:hypothetical protein